MFTLLLLRHADAVATAVGGDSQRPLSAFGRSQLEGLAARRQSELAAVGQWLVSPYLRTRQSYLELADPARPHAFCEALTPGASPTAAVAAIETAAASLLAADQPSSMAVVTHMPLVGELIERLCGERIGVPTAALTAIQFDLFGPHMGRLLWSDSR